jgi:hypothetical protein
MATWSYDYTAMIWAEKSNGTWRNVVAVYADTDGEPVTRTFEIPPFARPERERGEIYDPWEPLESAAERVLAENGWRVTECWNSAGQADTAPAERV